MTEKIKIEPIKLKEYETKQSKYDIAPKIPFRSIILGPSGSGKSIILQNMNLNSYRNCFSRIYCLVQVLMLTPHGHQLKNTLRMRWS